MGNLWLKAPGLRHGFNTTQTCDNLGLHHGDRDTYGEALGVHQGDTARAVVGTGWRTREYNLQSNQRENQGHKALRPYFFRPVSLGSQGIQTFFQKNEKMCCKRFRCVENVDCQLRPRGHGLDPTA